MWNSDYTNNISKNYLTLQFELLYPDFETFSEKTEITDNLSKELFEGVDGFLNLYGQLYLKWGSGDTANANITLLWKNELEIYSKNKEIFDLILNDFVSQIERTKVYKMGEIKNEIVENKFLTGILDKNRILTDLMDGYNKFKSQNTPEFKFKKSLEKKIFLAIQIPNEQITPNKDIFYETEEE